MSIYFHNKKIEVYNYLYCAFFIICKHSLMRAYRTSIFMKINTSSVTMKITVYTEIKIKNVSMFSKVN